jgi:hypothetical protein
MKMPMSAAVGLVGTAMESQGEKLYRNIYS